MELAAFLAQTLSCKRPIEGWVHVSIIYAVEKSGVTHFQLAGPTDQSPDRAVWAMVPEASKADFYDVVGAIYPLYELEGCELDLRLRAERCGDEILITVVDIERRALEAANLRRIRDSRRALVEFGYFQRQNDMPEPEVIRRIEVLHALDDRSWPAAKARLDALAASGVGYASRPIETDGISGFMALTIALDELKCRATAEMIDLVLILADESRSCPALVEIGTALPVGALPAHVIIGMPRGASESLLHSVAFAGCNSPAEAITVVEDLVRDARGRRHELQLRIQ